MINGEILKAVKTARAVFHPLSKARKTELRSCFSGAFKLSGLSCKRISESQVLPGLQISLLNEALRKTRQMDHSQVCAWLLSQFQHI